MCCVHPTRVATIYRTMDGSRRRGFCSTCCTAGRSVPMLDRFPRAARCWKQRSAQIPPFCTRSLDCEKPSSCSTPPTKKHRSARCSTARWRAVRSAVPWVVDESDTLLALIASVRGRLDSCDTLLQGIPPRGDHDPVADTRRLARALCDAQRGRVNTAHESLLSEPSSPPAAKAVRTGSEIARRLLAGRLDASETAGPEGEHSIGVYIALGAIERPGMPAPEVSVATARGLLAKLRDEQVLTVLEPLVSGRGEP